MHKRSALCDKRLEFCIPEMSMFCNSLATCHHDSTVNEAEECSAEVFRNFGCVVTGRAAGRPKLNLHEFV